MVIESSFSIDEGKILWKYFKYNINTNDHYKNWIIDSSFLLFLTSILELSDCALVTRDVEESGAWFKKHCGVIGLESLVVVLVGPTWVLVWQMSCSHGNTTGCK